MSLSIRHISLLARLLALLQLGLIALPSQAAIIKEKLPSGLYGVADYRAGSKNRPAVMILHGFLTTFNFNTVFGAIELLAENGYTVLAPNLSLGINARKQGLPCDAIHTHTMEQDLEETAFWVNWLVKQGAKNVVLIGHSIGSLILLAYASDKPHPAVTMLIATSMSFANNFNSDAEIKKQLRTAHEYKTKGDKSLYPYTLSYCKGNFLAPAEVYLSYSKWTKQRVLAALKRIRFPVHIIMGGADKRFDKQWLDQLSRAGANMIIIPGANHFFDDQHEFDLHDSFLTILEAGK